MTTQATQIWALCTSTSRDEPNVVGMADREVDDALARSFLADLPPELVGRLRAEGERADYPAGTTVYRAGSSSQAGLVVGGLLRVYLMSVEGRQVTVRYARPGDVLGVAVNQGGETESGDDAAAQDDRAPRSSARDRRGGHRSDHDPQSRRAHEPPTLLDGTSWASAGSATKPVSRSSA